MKGATDAVALAAIAAGGEMGLVTARDLAIAQSAEDQAFHLTGF
jgi:hypothetical protein